MTALRWTAVILCVVRTLLHLTMYIYIHSLCATVCTFYVHLRCCVIVLEVFCVFFSFLFYMIIPPPPPPGIIRFVLLYNAYIVMFGQSLFRKDNR